MIRERRETLEEEQRLIDEHKLLSEQHKKDEQVITCGIL